MARPGGMGPGHSEETYNKAKKQLIRAEKYCFSPNKCFLFYVYGNKYGEPEYKRIK
jgi:hypothetical protein